MAEWAARTGVPVGAVLPVEALYRLTRTWYADRLDRDWAPRSAAETRRRFAAAGLAGAFWEPA